MGSHAAAAWPPEENVTIERLAFLAAKPYLLRRSSPWWQFLSRLGDRGAKTSGWRGLGSGSGASARWPGANPPKLWPSPDAVGAANEVPSERTRSYVRACELAAAELSADERVALRERGELPGWFWRALDEHASAERARS